MNVQDAAHAIAHEYGLPELALRMGINRQVFNNKVNPGCATHVLSLNEAVRMQQLTGRYDILYAMADTLGYVCMPAPHVDDADVSAMLAHTCGEFGDYLREVERTMTDGRVTPNEVKRMQKELLELIASANALHGKLSSMVGRR